MQEPIIRGGKGVMCAACTPSLHPPCRPMKESCYQMEFSPCEITHAKYQLQLRWWWQTVRRSS